MIITFLEPKNRDDLSSDIPASYKQLKSYLLTHSEHRTSISMRYCESIEEIPDDVDIVGVSGATQNFNEVTTAGILVRERFHDPLLILGGHHISFMPETLPVEYDLGVMFEGEATLLEIVDRYISKGRDKRSLVNIRGVVWHGEQGEIRVNPPNALIEPLDRIPYPVLEGDSPSYIFSSRGCPYKCSFCASTAFWRNVRFHSAEYVLSHIEHIQRYNPQKNIVFWDDLVIADRKRFVEIVEGVEARGLNRDTSFGFAVRANLVDEEICELLVRLNTNWVSFGAESGSDRILQLLKGKSASVAANQQALDLLSRYGFVTTCSFVLGAPTETREDVKKTFDFIRRNVSDVKLFRSPVHMLMPLPGTQMWDYAIANKIATSPYDWNRFHLYANFRDTQVGGFDEWIKRRLECNSYYLNEDHIPHREMLDMLGAFEHELVYLEECRERQAQLQGQLSQAREKHAELERQLSEVQASHRDLEARLQDEPAEHNEHAPR